MESIQNLHAAEPSPKDISLISKDLTGGQRNTHSQEECKSLLIQVNPKLFECSISCWRLLLNSRWLKVLHFYPFLAQAHSSQDAVYSGRDKEGKVTIPSYGFSTEKGTEWIMHSFVLCIKDNTL